MEVFWAWVLDHIGISSLVLVALLSALIEITPIKLNPWKAIKNFFTTPAATAKEITVIKTQINTLNTEIKHVKENSSKLEKLDNNIQQINTQISEVKTNTNKINELNAQIQQLNTHMDSINDYIYTVNTSIDNVNTQVDKIHLNLDTVNENIEEIENNLIKEQKERREAHIETFRLTILNFGDELQRDANNNIGREHFDQIIRIIDDYEKYCENHPDFPNNQCLMTIQYIKDVYKKRYFIAN